MRKKKATNISVQISDSDDCVMTPQILAAVCFEGISYQITKDKEFGDVDTKVQRWTTGNKEKHLISIFKP